MRYPGRTIQYCLRLLLSLLLLAAPLRSAAVTHAELLEPLQRTIDFVYNMEFDAAVQGAQALIQQAPTHPAGFFALAAAYWQQRLVTTAAQPRQAMLERFQDAIQQTRNAAEKLSTSQAAEASFYLGAAYGMQARMHFVEKQYVRALLAAKQGSTALQQCVTHAPEWYDAYAGLGTYHYVLSRVPSLWRGMVQQLIGLPGNREQGLQALEQARAHGQLAVPEATLLLAKIYLLPDEMQLERAANLLAILSQRYPKNVDYRYRLLLAYAGLGHWDAVQSVIRGMQTTLEQSPASSGRAWLPLLQYRQAEAALFQHDLPQALSMLTTLRGQALELPLQAWVELRLGNVYDVRRERQAARAWYTGVSGDPEAERLARAYLMSPFTRTPVVVKPLEHQAI